MPNPTHKTSKLIDMMAGVIEAGWCQGTCAVDAFGRPEDPASPNATRWCLVGAARRVEFQLQQSVPSVWQMVLPALKEALPQEAKEMRLSPINWQDAKGRQRQDVVEMLRAAARAEREQGR